MGLFSFLFLTNGFAPLCTRISQTVSMPLAELTWRGVFPSWFGMSTKMSDYEEQNRKKEKEKKKKKKKKEYSISQNFRTTLSGLSSSIQLSWCLIDRIIQLHPRGIKSKWSFPSVKNNWSMALTSWTFQKTESNLWTQSNPWSNSQSNSWSHPWSPVSTWLWRRKGLGWTYMLQQCS